MITNVEKIREQASILEVVEAHVTLKKRGRLYEACCPVHDEKTPSFKVDVVKNSFHCYGACSHGGDAVDFLMWAKGYSFPDAVEEVAKICGIEVERSDRPNKSQEAHIFDVNAKAAAYYHSQLTDEVREYLYNRGYTAEMLALQQIGWAPASKNDFGRFLGDQFELGIKAGVLGRSEKGFVYDRFKERITFPIKNAQGQYVGFTARAIDAEKADKYGKYINTEKTDVFEKGKSWYGLHAAKFAIRKADMAIVVEGCIDVDMCHKVGIQNAIAALGTSVTDGHLKALRSYSTSICIVTDGDSAGKAAAFKLMLSAMEMGFFVYVAAIQEEGKDPADLCNTIDFPAWLQENRKDCISYVAMLANNCADVIERVKLLGKVKEAIGKGADDDVNAMYFASLREMISAGEGGSVDTGSEPQEAKPRRYLYELAANTADLEKHLAKFQIYADTIRKYGLQPIGLYERALKPFREPRKQQPIWLWASNGVEVIEAPEYGTENKVSCIGDDIPVFGLDALPESGKYVFLCQQPIEAMGIYSTLRNAAISAETFSDSLIKNLKERFGYVIYFWAEAARSSQKAWQGKLSKHKGLLRIKMPSIPFTAKWENEGTTLMEFFERQLPYEALAEAITEVIDAKESAPKQDYVLNIDWDRGITTRITTAPNGAVRQERIANFAMSFVSQVQILADGEYKSQRIISFRNERGQAQNAMLGSAPLTKLASFRGFLLDTLPGHFSFTGNDYDFQKMLEIAQQDEKYAKAFRRLGYLPEIGFVKGNSITLKDRKTIFADENGVVEIGTQQYFFAESCKINSRIEAWKQNFSTPTENSTTLEAFFKAYHGILGSDGITDILYAIACFHSSVIFAVDGFFPIHYLYGEASAGKTQRAKFLSGLQWRQFSPISLKGASTTAAIITTMSNLVDGINFLEEYNRDVAPNLKGALQDYYNRYGKSKMDAGRTVENEIGSGLFMTGNDRIEHIPLLTRMLFIHVKPKELDESFHQATAKINDWLEKGYHGLCLDIFALRGEFEKNYKSKYEQAKKYLSEKMKKQGGVVSRLIETASVLYATFGCVEGHIKLPFTSKDVVIRLIEVIDNMMREIKLIENTGFWDIFNILINRVSTDRVGERLIREWDYKLTKSKTYGDTLLEIPLSVIYSKYSSEVKRQGGTPKPEKEVHDWLIAQPYYCNKSTSSTFRLIEITERGPVPSQTRATRALRFKAFEMMEATGVVIPLSESLTDDELKAKMPPEDDGEKEDKSPLPVPTVNELAPKENCPF